MGWTWARILTSLRGRVQSERVFNGTGLDRTIFKNHGHNFWLVYELFGSRVGRILTSSRDGSGRGLGFLPVRFI
jgi:hypothetical protein